MSESYGHRLRAIHANPLNKCDHCSGSRRCGRRITSFSGRMCRGDRIRNRSATRTPSSSLRNGRTRSSRCRRLTRRQAGWSFGRRDRCVIIEKVVPKSGG